MKILVTGKGGSAGSWQCRGEQLGGALWATVKPMATAEDVAACDLTIVVKRTPKAVLDALKGKRWVYDIVDAYPQPECSAWSEREASAWVREHIERLKPTAVIWPNQRMRRDCDTGLPGIVLKHHHRPWIKRNPIREKVGTVGYEGDARYLCEWKGWLDKECDRRGWQFVVNPTNLADVDIVVAFRGGRWNGYPQRHWKSNVKLANAHASGTPFIGQRECGYLETSTGAEYWAGNAKELGTAFDWLQEQTTREQIQERFLKAAYSVNDAAKDLGTFLGGL